MTVSEIEVKGGPPVFSITINKAQGQSVKRVRIGLRVPVFSRGQLYVVLAWATNS